METDLTQLKCDDCMRMRTSCQGMIFWQQTYCEVDGKPVNKNQSACISISPKLSARERRECKDKLRTH